MVVRAGGGRSGGRFRKYRSSASEGERNSTVENPAFLSFSSNAAGSKLLIHGSPTEAAASASGEGASLGGAYVSTISLPGGNEPAQRSV